MVIQWYIKLIIFIKKIHKYNKNTLYLQYKCNNIMIKYSFQIFKFITKLGSCGLV